MALRRDDRRDGLTPYDEYQSKRRDASKRTSTPEEDDRELTPEEQSELDLARYCMGLLQDGIRARDAYEVFDEAWDTYSANLWPARYPVWKSRITINKIRALVHFEQAVMVDNKPRISVDPIVPGSEDAADILRKILDRDWDENEMQDKVALAVLYGLIWGTGLIKITYNPRGDGGRGKHEAQAVVPYRIYTNRTATCVEDAEYIIHVEDQTLNWVWRNFPDKAHIVEQYRGGRVATKNRVDRDLVREGLDYGGGRSYIDNAMRTENNQISQPQTKPYIDGLIDDDTIEVAEFWFHDPTTEKYLRQVMKHGEPQYEDALDDKGFPILEIAGYVQDASPLDGMPVSIPIVRTKKVPKMEWAERPKYPNGRLVVMAGPCVLRDIPNPFQIDGFPFASWKCYDVGTFWGSGEPLALKDCAVAINRMVSQIYDILEKTGNPSYKYKKGHLDIRTLKNKPGSLVPLEEMESFQLIQPPSVAPQFMELVGLLKTSMGEITGLHDSVMGNMPGGNTAFATIDQLQESGAAPLRQKARNMEKMIKRCGTLRLQLVQQFDQGERPLRERVEEPQQPIVDDETGEIIDLVQPASDVAVKFRRYSAADIQGVVEFGIVPDSSLSTSPAGMFNRYLQLYDKRLIDQQAVLEKIRIDGYRQILARMQAAQARAVAAKMKPGPKPQDRPRVAKRPQAPQSQLPTREANSAVR